MRVDGAKPPTAVTLGNFDGPHRGHHAIVAECRRLADAAARRAGQGERGRVVAVTFDPPPVEVLRPGSGPPQLASVASRVAALRTAGADAVEVVRPTPALLKQDAEAYVTDLVQRHRPMAVVEGPDFRFGRDRGGDMALLERKGREHGFTAVTVPRVTATLGDQSVVPVSSSLVRWLVGRGRVADARAALGMPFSLTATVVRGEQRGRSIGVPTANLNPASLVGRVVPADGVYAAWATRGEAEASRAEAIPAAVSIGVKPTFGQRALTVEAHLIGCDADLYGETLTLRFARWLRGQYPFPGVAALRRQLGRDIDTVGRWCPIPATS